MTQKDVELSKFVMSKFFGEEEKVDTKFTINDFNRDLKKQTLAKGDIFFGKINTTVKKNGKKCRINDRKDIYLIENIETVQDSTSYTVKDFMGEQYKTSKASLTILTNSEARARAENWLIEMKQKEMDIKAERLKNRQAELGFKFLDLTTEEKLNQLTSSGLRNIWMVGPAGCGKSTMARNFAEANNYPYLCISCSIGTSAVEFVGYKYPEREGTKFGVLYNKASVIVIDEMPALDPSVAQVLNAALANGEIETTTGLVRRHKDCIIIATSNTYGTGADRQYVANNQLDSSTIDRFVGGIIEVDYSEKFESQFDKEVVNYIKLLRKLIKQNNWRRIASTRMIEAGHDLKYKCILDWKEILIQNWSAPEIELVKKSTK